MPTHEYAPVPPDLPRNPPGHDDRARTPLADNPRFQRAALWGSWFAWLGFGAFGGVFLGVIVLATTRSKALAIVPVCLGGAAFIIAVVFGHLAYHTLHAEGRARLRLTTRASARAKNAHAQSPLWAHDKWRPWRSDRQRWNFSTPEGDLTLSEWRIGMGKGRRTSHQAALGLPNADPDETRAALAAAIGDHAHLCLDTMTTLTGELRRSRWSPLNIMFTVRDDTLWIRFDGFAIEHMYQVLESLHLWARTHPAQRPPRSAAAASPTDQPR